MKDLQAIIDGRAKARLEKELTELHDFLYEKKYKFLNDSGVQINIGTAEKPIAISIASIFSTHHRVYKELFNYHIEKYKERETETFLKEIDELKQRASKLEEDISYLQ